MAGRPIRNLAILIAMRHSTAVAAVLLAVLLAFVAPGMAHHSISAEYDFSRTITLKGTIVKVDWGNPHVWIRIDGTEPDGKTALWAFEMADPRCMEKHGIAVESLAVGSAVTVRNAPKGKDGTRHALLISASDGNKTVQVVGGGPASSTLELKSLFDRRPAVRPEPRDPAQSTFVGMWCA